MTRTAEIRARAKMRLQLNFTVKQECNKQKYFNFEGFGKRVLLAPLGALYVAMRLYWFNGGIILPFHPAQRGITT